MTEPWHFNELYGLVMPNGKVALNLFDLDLDYLNRLEAKAALADEAMHYCEFSRPFSNEDDAFWDTWQARYDALKEQPR